MSFPTIYGTITVLLFSLWSHIKPQQQYNILETPEQGIICILDCLWWHNLATLNHTWRNSVIRRRVCDKNHFFNFISRQSFPLGYWRRALSLKQDIYLNENSLKQQFLKDPTFDK